MNCEKLWKQLKDDLERWDMNDGGYDCPDVMVGTGIARDVWELMQKREEQSAR